MVFYHFWSFLSQYKTNINEKIHLNFNTSQSLWLIIDLKHLILQSLIEEGLHYNLLERRLETLFQTLLQCQIKIYCLNNLQQCYKNEKLILILERLYKDLRITIESSYEVNNNSTTNNNNSINNN